MGDVAKGIKNFKQGMSDEDAKDDVRDAGRTIDAKADETVKDVKKTTKS